MTSRLLLTVSALCLGVAGALLLFLPQELLVHVRQPDARILVVFVQTIGAAYLAFAMLNWMSRGATVGGIYARPLVVANLVHFAIVGLSLVKWAMAGAPPGIMVLAAIYTLFAIGFGRLLFASPSR